MQWITNILLRFTYKYFRKLRTKKVFTGKVTFECDFNSEDELNDKFLTIDNEFYNVKPILFTKECVKIIPEGLKILCIKEAGFATTWQRADIYNYKTGCIRTWDRKNGGFSQIGGTWVVNAIFPETWAALWLLQERHLVDNKYHITPEIDFAENNGNIENVVHYGYDKFLYATKGKLAKMHKPDGKMHEYAVEILPNGYKFYLDGYLVNKFTSKDKEFVFESEKYLIINNAVKSFNMADYSEFIIKNVKCYENTR